MKDLERVSVFDLGSSGECMLVEEGGMIQQDSGCTLLGHHIKVGRSLGSVSWTDPHNLHQQQQCSEVHEKNRS